MQNQTKRQKYNGAKKIKRKKTRQKNRVFLEVPSINADLTG